MWVVFKKNASKKTQKTENDTETDLQLQNVQIFIVQKFDEKSAKTSVKKLFCEKAKTLHMHDMSVQRMLAAFKRFVRQNF